MTDDLRARWNARYRDLGDDAARHGPATFLTERAQLLPRAGRALDVAGGAGRNARWLAGRGLDVTLVDLSDEACRLATAHAAAQGLDIEVRRCELGAEPLPPGPFEVVLIVGFLDRQVWEEAADRLAPGGVLLASQPTVRNLAEHDRPPRPFLLDEGEVERMAAQHRDVGREVLEASEGWADGRHQASLVVRRPS